MLPGGWDGGYSERSWAGESVVRVQWCLSAGVIDEETARRIRSAGEEAHRAAVADQWPFRADWDRWLPDPTWPDPALPGGWTDVAVTLEAGPRASAD